MTKIFNDNNFDQEVIEASKIKPVLVDFYGEWCGPCKMMAPIVDEIATDIGEKAVVGKIDIDQSGALAEKYDVMSVPTFFIIKNGQIVETLMGAQPKEGLISALNRYIS